MLIDPDAKVYHFKVMYLMKNSHITVHEDMVEESLASVMMYLKAKGVTKGTVQQLFVHQITKDGIAELVTIDTKDEKKGKQNVRPLDDKPPFEGPSNNVIDITTARAIAARNNKPHIRLKAADVEAVVVPPKPRVVTQGLYQAAML